jgi:lipoprotein NlpD
MRCRRVPLLVLLVASMLLAACAPRTSVRVQPAERPATPRTAPLPVGAGTYVVVRGDTLYGIAFRHGLDYRQLAQLNAIAPPYTIYPGQRLRLGSAPPPPVASVTPAAPPGRAAPSRGSVIAPIVSDRESAPPVPASPPSVQPATPTAQPTPATATPPPVTAPVTAAPPAPAPLPAGAPRWRWPAEGALVASFAPNDPTRQGINIAGSAGQPVTAAADGVVVYSGSGLIGYGELVIVKHSDEWLSAYGHNRKRLVNEGQAVKAGQQIAEMGRSGASRDMLHFEIRRNGRPVDPQGLLPRR